MVLRRASAGALSSLRERGAGGWQHPDYLAVAQQINQVELYKQAASALKISVPKSAMRSSKLIDGVVWDGKDRAKYADGFKVKA